MTRLFLRWWLLWMAMAVLLSTGCARSKCQTCPRLTLDFQYPDFNIPKEDQDVFQMTIKSDDFDWMVKELDVFKKDGYYCYQVAWNDDNVSVCLLDPIGFTDANNKKAFRVSRVRLKFTLTSQESTQLRNSQNISVELLGTIARDADSTNPTLQVFDKKTNTAVIRPRDKMKFTLSGQWLTFKGDKQTCQASFDDSKLRSFAAANDNNATPVRIIWSEGCD